nr:hypothetical protein [Lachnospiraceae bacterium]
MGAWGPGLYQDDIAEDVKVRYEENLRKGLSGTEITKILIEENEYILDDAEEASVFWFALADTQWKFGRLEDSVKNKAIACLEEGTNLKIWEESEEPKAYKKRQEVLNALKERLLSEQPPEKKIRI